VSSPDSRCARWKKYKRRAKEPSKTRPFIHARARQHRENRRWKNRKFYCVDSSESGAMKSPLEVHAIDLVFDPADGTLLAAVDWSIENDTRRERT